MKKIYSLALMVLFSSQIWAQIISETCEVPTAVTAIGLYGTSATISWAGVSPVESFNYSYKKKTDSQWKTDFIDNNQVTLKNLTPSTDYVIKIQNSCELNKKGDDSIVSSWTTEFNFTTKDASVTKPCNPPTGLSIVSVDSTEAKITWTSDMEDFEIYYKAENETKWTQEYYYRYLPQLLFDLTPNTKYSVVIYSICGDTLSDGSDSTSIESQMLNFTTTGKGNSDTTINDSTNTNIKFNKFNKFSINVFADYNHINIFNNEDIKINEVVVINMMGAEVARYNVNKTGNVILNTNLTEGNYILRVIADNKIVNYKVFIK